MVRNFAIAYDVFQTSELIRKYCCQKIFRFHALQWRGYFCAATKPRHRKGTCRIPAPANREHRRVEQGLDQEVTHRFGIQIAKNLLKRERMLRAKRNHDCIICRCRLELEIERTTKTFSQRESPCAVDPITKWRVKNQLHPARFIKKALHHQSLLRRNCAERPISVREVFADRFRRFIRQPHFVDQLRTRGSPLDTQRSDCTPE